MGEVEIIYTSLCYEVTSVLQKETQLLYSVIVFRHINPPIARKQHSAPRFSKEDLSDPFSNTMSEHCP